MSQLLEVTEKRMFDRLTEKIDEQEARIFMVEKEDDVLRHDFQEICLEWEKQQDEIQKLHRKVDEISNKQNDLEQHGRLSSIRIYGLEGGSKRDTVSECSDKLLHGLNKELGMDTQATDIDVTHRLAHTTDDTLKI